MKKTLLLFLFLFYNNATSAEISLQLDKGWIMKSGDNQEWSSPDLDDSNWQTIQVGVPWEDAGYIEYDGFAWYRLKFIIPADWQQLDENDFLSLEMGAIDDADVTYFNGKEIGATGSLPPDYQSAYYTLRFYRIPRSIIQWGETNVLAVRVYDGYGDGGLCQGPFILRQPQFNDLISMKKSMVLGYEPEKIIIPLTRQADFETFWQQRKEDLLQDDVCPPRISFAPYNKITSTKEYRVYAFAGHAVWHEQEKVKDEGMARMLGIEKIE
ncbi:acetylxylan esterase [candidate division KSB1 bacterium]|nr:acetylxylan esterase [candidate division KSB1 bacterium]